MSPKKDGKGKGGGNPLEGGAEPQPPGQQAEEEELPPEGPNPFAPAAAEPAEEAAEFAGEVVEEEVVEKSQWIQQ